ncbi:MAG: phosphodiester glycosidase family protein [Lachnospiraceae bacterium]|nr:phosphodiester glycosidase family protein [Lachnospiraceae bacterium]
MTEAVNKTSKKRKKKWKIPSTILTLLLAGTVFACIGWGVKHGPVKLLPAGDPGETVRTFMEHVVLAEYEEAAACTNGKIRYTSANSQALREEDGVVGAIIADHLEDGFTYETISECQVEDLEATQTIRVNFYQVSKMAADLSEDVQAILARFVDERDVQDVYDADRNYLPSVIEEAYTLAIEDRCNEDISAYLSSMDIDVHLSYTGGKWIITEAKGLEKAILGIALQEPENDFASVMTALRADSLQNLTYVRKIYTIPEHAMAPAENQAAYGQTTNPEDIDAVIAAAEELLEGQELAWNPNADFAPRSVIKYYLDETLLVICWKEIIEGKCCAMAEIKIADGSQLRRTIAGGEYGSSIQLLPTTMARESNAVLALSGDFYAFRPLGITVYDRKVYRFAPQTIDTCYFTAGGDMMFTYAGEPATIEEAQQFVDDNDITFAVAFGPILVDHGQLREIKSYPIGEVNETYSRTTFAQKDHLHYLLMCINYEGVTRAATIQQSARFIYEKGVQMAYALDGGQTSTMIINDTLYNCVDFNAERLMSDIIYFSTALPSEEE